MDDIKDLDIEKCREFLFSNGYVVLPILNKQLIKITQEATKNLQRNDSNLLTAERNTWHELVKSKQDELNGVDLLNLIICSQSPLIEELIQEPSLAWVNVVKLRAVRPIRHTKIGDHVPFHRETLYASNAQVRHQFNLWIPISSAATVSGLQYLPGSHCILDSTLEIENTTNHPSAVSQFSAGHAIGYPYRPRLIKNLSELTNSQPQTAAVPIGHCILFSAMLIHGNGINKTKSTRFSIDTGFIPSRYLLENKKIHATMPNTHYRITGAKSIN